MNQTLEILGFQPLSQFIEQNIKIKVQSDNIFIKCTIPVPNFTISNIFPINEILSLALAKCEDNNQLSMGYNKTKKEWYGLNTSRNILKSAKWEQIFESIGFDYSIFILVNCLIVEKIGENFIILCGDAKILCEKKAAEIHVARDLLFREKSKNSKVLIEQAIYEIIGSDILFGTSNPNENNKENIKTENIENIEKTGLKRNVIDSEFTDEIIAKLALKLKTVLTKYNNLPIDAIFKSFFTSNLKNTADSIMENAIEPEKIANFLFLISKKFLKPIFTEKEFKILKGKLVLLTKRNVYETLNLEDLIKYFSTKKFKLFDNLSMIRTQIKTKILKNFMIFLFNSIYLRIISVHFYSTISSFSKRQIHYFSRNQWNIKVSNHFSEYLNYFEKVDKPLQTVATLRCIPKESELRVITNCSVPGSCRSKENEIKEFKNNCKLGNSTNNANNNANANSNINNISNINNNVKDNLSKAKNNTINFSFQDPLTNVSKLAQIYSDISKVLADQRASSNKKLTRPSSINYKASPLLPILKNIFYKNQGFSLLRHMQIQKKLYNLLSSKKNRLILLKVDLKQCFDNIPQDDVLKIIDDLLINDEYFYQEMQIFKNSHEKAFLRRELETILPLNMPEAQPKDHEIPKSFNSGFLIKESKTRVFKKQEIYKMLTEVIKNTTIKYQNSYYKKRNGIPQGCSISSIICAIYYAFLDKQFSDLNCFISRYVDDFLIITENIEDIKKFFDKANQLKDKGFVINLTKIDSNIANLDLNGLDQIMYSADSVESAESTESGSEIDFNSLDTNLDKHISCNSLDTNRFRHISFNSLDTNSSICSSCNSPDTNRHRHISFNSLDANSSICSSCNSPNKNPYRHISCNSLDTNSNRQISFNSLDTNADASAIELDRCEMILNSDQSIPEMQFKSKFVNWCGIKIYDQGVNIKSECQNSHFRFSISIHSTKRGQKIFEHLKKSLAIKLSPLLVNYKNRKTGENLFDGLFFVARKLKILILRAGFINENFVNKILNYFQEEVNRILKERKIKFDSFKIEEIARKAFERSGVLDIKKDKWRH